jgi:hypothetical protein
MEIRVERSVCCCTGPISWAHLQILFLLMLVIHHCYYLCHRLLPVPDRHHRRVGSTFRSSTICRFVSSAVAASTTMSIGGLFAFSGRCKALPWFRLLALNCRYSPCLLTLGIGCETRLENSARRARFIAALRFSSPAANLPAACICRSGLDQETQCAQDNQLNQHVGLQLSSTTID